MIMANSKLTGNGRLRGFSYGSEWGEVFRTIKPHLPFLPCWEAETTEKNTIKETYMKNTAKSFPDIADEIEGIAQGAGVPVNTILDWVLVDGFTWGFDNNFKNSSETMCTNLSFINSCDEPMLMQTMDAPDGSLMPVHHVHPGDGYKHTYIGRLGSVVAVNGFNEKGLAMGGVSSYSSTWDINGFMCGMLIRACLQYCSTTDEVITLFTENDLMCGGYTTNCLDSSLNNVVIEKRPGKQAIRYNTEDYIYNTRLITQPMSNESSALFALEKRGYDRLDTFKHLMEQEVKPYSIDTMIRVMSDHSETGPIWTWSTRYGCIMLPNSSEMRVYLGPPDETSYEIFTI